MARPREFDIDEAIERAMQVFWTKGYEGASLQDLLDAMKIARGSLYKAFQDKRTIYLAALDRYDRTAIQRAVDVLGNAETGDGSARIRLFLDDASAAIVRRKDRRGCFMCNAAVDQAPIDAEVREKVAAMMKRMEHAVSDALNDSSRTSSWSRKRRDQTALMLINAYLGLRILARSGAPPRDLAAVIDMTSRSCGLETDGTG